MTTRTATAPATISLIPLLRRIVAAIRPAPRNAHRPPNRHPMPEYRGQVGLGLTSADATTVLSISALQSRRGC